MSTEEQIARARAARKRRDKFWTIADIPLLVLYLLTLGASFGSDNPLLGLMTLAYAIFTAARPLMVDGRDAWQLHRALRAFSIAGGVTLVYLVVDAVQLGVNEGYESSPGGALRIFALVWLTTNLAMQYGGIWLGVWRPRALDDE